MRNVFALILFHIFSSDVVLGEPSPYKVLGISRNANIIEIKKAYRKLAKELHPDKHPDDKAAHEKFQELGSAYEILSDKDKRRAYDTYGTSEMNNKAYQEQYGFNPFSAFFDSFFSESLSQPYHRPNKKDFPHFRRIFVSFDEVFNRNQRFAKYVFVHV